APELKIALEPLGGSLSESGQPLQVGLSGGAQVLTDGGGGHFHGLFDVVEDVSEDGERRASGYTLSALVGIAGAALELAEGDLGCEAGNGACRGGIRFVLLIVSFLIPLVGFRVKTELCQVIRHCQQLGARILRLSSDDASID